MQVRPSLAQQVNPSMTIDELEALAAQHGVDILDLARDAMAVSAA